MREGERVVLCASEERMVVRVPLRRTAGRHTSVSHDDRRLVREVEAHLVTRNRALIDGETGGFVVRDPCCVRAASLAFGG